MADTAIYRDPVIAAVFSTIKANIGSPSPIKKYYYGDPILLPRDYLPALMCSKDRTPIETYDNQQDLDHMRLVLTLVTDVRPSFNITTLDSDDDPIDPKVNQLYDIMEGRETNFLKKTTSLAHIIRHNRSLGTSNHALDVDLKTVSEIEFFYTIGKRAEAGLAIEASFSFIVNFLQLR